MEENRDFFLRVAEKKYLLTGLLGFFLGLITFLVYVPSLHYGFVFDDLPTIIEYIHVRVFDPLGNLFGNPRWISRILNQWTYKHWVDNPFGYRIFDLCFFIAIGFMLFLLLLKLCNHSSEESLLKKHSYWLATLVTGLFLLHPAQTQTATYITQIRLEGLVVFFTLLMVFCFVYAAFARNLVIKTLCYLLLFTVTIFAAGTKEIIVIAPFLLMLIDWFFVAQGQWYSFKKRLLIHGMVISLMVYMFSFLVNQPMHRLARDLVSVELRNNRGNMVTENYTEKIKPGQFFISQFKIIVHYLTIFFDPSRLSFDYDVRLERSFFSRGVIYPFMFLLILACSLLMIWIKNPVHPLVFGFLWFFIALLPRASIFPSTELVCDYKTFLPSIGIFFVQAVVLLYVVSQVAKIGARLLTLSQRTIYLAQGGVTGLFLIYLGFGTVMRNQVWESELTLWKDVIEKAPFKSRGYNNYAVALWERGNSEQAIDAYKKSIELDGNYGEPHVNLAAIFQGMGRDNEALYHYKKALETGEVHPQLYHNLGLFHLSKNNEKLAEQCFKDAVKYRPYFTSAWTQLGKLYQKQQRYQEALASYDQGLKGDNGNDPTLVYLHATVDYMLGNIDRAFSFFSLLDAKYADVAFQLGCCLYAKNDYRGALPYFEQAYKQNTHNVMLTYNYAMTLLNLNRYQEALHKYKQCTHVGADLPYLSLHMAHCMVKLGFQNEAKKEVKNLVKTTLSEQIKGEAMQFMQEHKLT